MGPTRFMQLGILDICRKFAAIHRRVTGNLHNVAQFSQVQQRKFCNSSAGIQRIRLEKDVFALARTLFLGSLATKVNGKRWKRKFGSESSIRKVRSKSFLGLRIRQSKLVITAKEHGFWVVSGENKGARNYCSWFRFDEPTRHHGYIKVRSS